MKILTTKLTTMLPLLFILFSSPIVAAGIETDKLPQLSGIAKHTNNNTWYFAATSEGLFVSGEGHSWTPVFNSKMPATLITETSHGELYTFILGEGLLKYDDTSRQWKLVNNQLGSQILINLSGDSATPDKLVALNQYRKLIVSENAGKDWHSIKGKYKATSESEKRGQSLFVEKCQSCHGINGVGETYNFQSLTDKNYIRAPALNASEHAWHHTDDALAKTILEGSPRTERMKAWGKEGVNDENAADLVAYIKSLWTQRELDCQGPKHMQCMK